MSEKVPSAPPPPQPASVTQAKVKSFSMRVRWLSIVGEKFKSESRDEATERLGHSSMRLV